MTAEELAEIKDRAARVVKRAGDDCADLDDYQLAQAMDAPPLARFILSLPDTDAQAQRIAELEAAARGPDRNVLAQEICRAMKKDPFARDGFGDPSVPGGFHEFEAWEEFIDVADALLSSGALATAQAEQRTMADAGKDSLEYIQATKAARPTQEGEKL